MSENSYLNYQTMLSKINTCAVDLKRICQELDLPEHATALTEVSNRLQNHVFRVGIMGEFKRGKSTVINALLGQEIVPADILPCSATLNRIVWDAIPHATIHFRKTKNGQTLPPKEISVEELSNYVTKLTAESAEQADLVEDAIVHYPCQFCKNGVEIIDTPGLNDDERMDSISESVIPSLDAIIMVIVPGSPFSVSEANFVRNKIMTSDLSRLIFVVNKMDTVRPRERKRCIDGIRQKIEGTILEKCASMYGKDSPEYQATQNKLGGIRIYPISAADALDAKLDNDDELLKESGMPEFEAALARLLTEERGILELIPTVNTTFSKIRESIFTIIMRKNAMHMETEKFEQMQKEAMEKIDQCRNGKKQKVQEIKGIASALYQELQPDIANAYAKLESSLNDFAEHYPITPDNFSNQDAKEQFHKTISEKISQEFETCLQESTEKIQTKIQERLLQEMDNLETFTMQFASQLDEVRYLIPEIHAEVSGKKKKIDEIDMVAMGIETLTTMTFMVPGIGGAISGFKDHGIMGGVVGFGSGFLATSISLIAAVTAIGASTATILPTIAVAGIMGTFGGKKFTDGVFKLVGKLRKNAPDNILMIRNNLKENILKNMKDLRTERVLENWLHNVTDETFQALSEKLDQETEETLQGLQETLTNIQIDLNNGKVHQAEVLEKLNRCHEELKKICGILAPIKMHLDTLFGHSTENTEEPL